VNKKKEKITQEGNKRGGTEDQCYLKVLHLVTLNQQLFNEKLFSNCSDASNH
jgi:hypothetical protein